MPNNDAYKKTFDDIKVSEQAVERTIRSAERMCGERISITEFFWIQVKLIRKQWWVLQAAVLVCVWMLLLLSGASENVQRGMSIAASMFVVLMIPEIWKNRDTSSMEIEEAAFYSLKQIYAVKIISFGLVDVFMITVFCIITGSTQNIPVFELLKQLVFPLLVSAGVCFSVLCSKRHFDEIAAVISSFMINVIWTFIVLNDSIYNTITPLLWAVLFFAAGIFIVISIGRTLSNCRGYWEVVPNEISNR